MNGTTYGAVTSRVLGGIAIQDSYFVPKDPSFNVNKVPSGGGLPGQVTDALINGGGMYDNHSSVWSPMNKFGAIKMAYGKPEGPPSAGFMDPTINGSQKLSEKFTRPISQPVTRPVYNFI